MFGRKKGNWLIVCHTWHVNSKGFFEKLLIDATEKEANAEAALLADRHRGTCCAAKAKSFPLPDTIVVIKT